MNEYFTVSALIQCAKLAIVISMQSCAYMVIGFTLYLCCMYVADSPKGAVDESPRPSQHGEDSLFEQCH